MGHDHSLQAMVMTHIILGPYDKTVPKPPERLTKLYDSAWDGYIKQFKV